MSVELQWPEIALRLVLTVAAGGLLGFERSRTGHAAGLRTVLLVTLAASIAMIQMNLLLPTNGKPPDSYAVMDMMRLPLGILTGVGFIGAGAIVHKNELVVGVTTAATLWFATVVGLCMGGGQVILGSVSTAIGVIVLWGLHRVERSAELYQLGEVKITCRGDELRPEILRERLEAHQYRIKSLAFTNCIADHTRTFDCEVRWKLPPDSAVVPELITELSQLPGVVELKWKSSASGTH